MTYTTKTSHFSFLDHPNILNSCAQAILWWVQHKINHDHVNTIKGYFHYCYIGPSVPLGTTEHQQNIAIWCMWNIIIDTAPLQYKITTVLASQTQGDSKERMSVTRCLPAKPPSVGLQYAAAQHGPGSPY